MKDSTYAIRFLLPLTSAVPAHGQARPTTCTEAGMWRHADRDRRRAVPRSPKQRAGQSLICSGFCGAIRSLTILGVPSKRCRPGSPRVRVRHLVCPSNCQGSCRHAPSFGAQHARPYPSCVRRGGAPNNPLGVARQGNGPLGKAPDFWGYQGHRG